MKTQPTNRKHPFTLTVALFAIVAFSITATAQTKVGRALPAQKVTKFSGPKLENSQKAVKLRGVNVAGPNANNGPQPSTVTASTYAFTNATGATPENMSSGTTQLIAANQDDTASPVTNIGFEVWFDGVRQTQFSVNANGLFGLGGTAVNNGTSGRTNDFATTTNNPKMSSYWDDMCTAATGKVHYKVVGSAPNRKLVVEWLNMVEFDNITTFVCSPTIMGSYQLWLFESTGVIQLVNGGMAANDSGSGGYSVGIGSSSTSFASVTPAGPTVSYAASSNANAGAIASGTQYTFTPNTPTAPTGLNFTGVTQVAATLNWTDTSSNEFGFVVYRSTDGGTTYNFLAQTAANAVSFTDSTLSPSTTYFYQVKAVTEGTLSSATANSVTTLAPGAVSSTAVGGPWSSTATWVGGVLPTAGDNVTIVAGATVTIDTAAVALGVTVNNTASLLWDTAAARTLTVGINVVIDNGGTFATGASGTVTTHVLSLGGSLTNNGTLDFSTNGNTAGAGITFTGAASNTFGGTGGATDIRTITVNKGANANVLELNPTNFTVQGVNTDVAGFLTITGGTFKISGTFTMTNRTFAVSGYAIPAAGGFWLNNANYTVAGQNGTGTVTGLFRLTQGTYNLGTATTNALSLATNSTTIIEGGTLTATGRVAVSSATNTVNYTQTGGTITVCTIGNTSTTLGNFDLGTSAASNVTMSGGTIIIRLHSSGIDYRYDADPTNLTGTTVQLGDAGSGAAKAFSLRGVLPNLVITNTSAAHTATFNGTLVNFYHVITGNVTINTGNTLNLAGDATSVNTFFEGNILNNGILNASNVNMTMQMQGTSVQTYSGTGTMTAPTTGMNIDGGGMDFTGATNQQVITRINLFSGGIAGANKITLGNGGATSAFMQIGNGGLPATTVGAVTGTIVNNAGTGGYTVFYGAVDADRSTGGEIPASRTVTNVTFDGQGANVTIAGGDLTVTGSTIFGDAADTLGNGRVITGANTLIIGSAGTVSRVGGLGHVDGNLRKTFTAAASTNFEVGTANGYSPVTVNATAGTFPADFTAKAVQGPQPNMAPATSLQRYWTLAATGITADLTFNYLDPTDLMGTEANYVIFKYDGTLTMPGGSVNTGANTATITGVSAFSDWTLGEPSVPLVASSALSRLSHAGNDFDVNLPLSGPAGVESRNNGGFYEIHVSFGSNVTFSSAAVTSGTGSVLATSGGGSPNIVINLTGVTNAQVLTVTLQGATNGTNSGDIAVSMGVLAGDTNGDGLVNSGDIAQTKSKTGQTVDLTNFRADVNIDNSLNSADISLVKSRSGTALP